MIENPYRCDDATLSVAPCNREAPYSAVVCGESNSAEDIKQSPSVNHNQLDCETACDFGHVRCGGDQAPTESESTDRMRSRQ